MERAAPRVTVAREANQATISWVGPPHDTISYNVQISVDGGHTWQTVAANLKANSLPLDTTQFAGVAELQIRVMATNGLATEPVGEQSIQLRR